MDKEKNNVGQRGIVSNIREHCSLNQVFGKYMGGPDA